MSKKILFVDDETQILRSLARLFTYTEFEIFTAESAQQALEIMSKQEVNLIITDMRMPFMDGYQLLSEVKQKYPHVLRVILSGYTDEKIIFKALQQNVAKLYLFKPWENEKLLKMVEDIFKTEELIKNDNLLLLINNIKELPTIKSSYQKLVTLIDSDAEIEQIVQALEADQAIATKILHIINSAFYTLKTGSLKKAVTYLGLANIREIIVSTSILEFFQLSSAGRVNMELLWQHSFLCNKLVSFIFEKILKKKMPETAMSAGLLHDVGIIFFLQHFNEKYLEIYNEVEKNQLCLNEEEIKYFFVDHQQTGAYLLSWWELPYPIVETALYHHTPFDDKVVNRELVCVVHLAERYSWDFLHHPYNQFFDEGVFDYLAINKQEFEQELQKIQWDEGG